MNRYAIGIGLLVAVIAVVVYYTSKPGNPGACLPSTAPGDCPNTWVDSAGKPVAATKVCDPNTLRWKLPNFGPGQCQVPCPPGTVPCWDSKAGKGTCVPAGGCPCQADGDCSGSATCVPTGTGGTRCVCRPGFAPPDCKTPGACADGPGGKGGTCGAHGHCDPQKEACLCDDGYDPATLCTTCLPGRGPGGAAGCALTWRTVNRLTGGCYQYVQSSEGDHYCQTDSRTGGTMGEVNQKGEKGTALANRQCGYTVPDGTGHMMCQDCFADVVPTLCAVTGWLPAAMPSESCYTQIQPGAWKCNP